MNSTNPYIYDYKDQSPIRFEFYQSDVEKMLFFMGEATLITAQVGRKDLADNLNKVLEDWNRKILIHKDRGEWK